LIQIRPSDQARPRWAIGRGALGLGLLVAASGCTTTNVVTLSPLRTTYPVSASSAYVESDGTIVKETQYQVVKPFKFTREVQGPRHQQTQSQLTLEPALDRIVAQAQGDAVTRVRIAADRYSSGSHTSSGVFKVMGWTFSLLGTAVLGLAAGVQALGRSESTAPIWGTGGAIVGVGALFFVFGSLANDPSMWSLQVSGNVVQRNGGAPRPPRPPQPWPPETSE
jgi:hypothetical protein